MTLGKCWGVQVPPGCGSGTGQRLMGVDIQEARRRARLVARRRVYSPQRAPVRPHCTGIVALQGRKGGQQRRTHPPGIPKSLGGKLAGSC